MERKRRIRGGIEERKERKRVREKSRRAGEEGVWKG